MAEPNTIILPSVDSDVIHRLALQSDYVARYAELAEVCRVAILRATATASLIAASASSAGGAAGGGVGAAAAADPNKDILTVALTVLKSSIPTSDSRPAGVGGAIYCKLLLAFTLHTALTAAAPATPDAAITTVKDECSKALQRFRNFYQINMHNIARLKIGDVDTTVAIAQDDIQKVFRRPQTGGKRPKNKKTQKKSRKSRK
jgi:hypothetical protein